MGVGRKTGLCQGSAEGETQSTEGWKGKGEKHWTEFTPSAGNKTAYTSRSWKKGTLRGILITNLEKKHLCWAIKTNTKLIINKTDNEGLTGICIFLILKI